MENEDRKIVGGERDKDDLLGRRLRWRRRRGAAVPRGDRNGDALGPCQTPYGHALRSTRAGQPACPLAITAAVGVHSKSAEPGFEVTRFWRPAPGGAETREMVMASCWCSPSACTVNLEVHRGRDARRRRGAERQTTAPWGLPALREPRQGAPGPARPPAPEPAHQRAARTAPSAARGTLRAPG